MPSHAATRALDRVASSFRSATRSTDVLSRYARDPLAHLEDGHVKVLDLVSLEAVTFVPWPHQVEAIRAWIDLDHLAKTGTPRWRNVVEEKSRQEGMTWLLVYCELWALSYHNLPGLMMHLDGREVDDGGSGSTPDSFFGKLRWMHGQLPSKYQAPLVFKYLKIRHSFNAFGFLDGETAGPDAGRGGRYARGIIDEAARIPFGESVHQAMTRAIPRGRFYNSTPNGEDNVYGRLVKRTPKGYVKMRHHWANHPVYSVGAHIAAVADVDRDGVAQEQPVQPSPEHEQAAAGCELCAGNREGLRWQPEDPKCHRYPGKVTSPWYDEAVTELTDEQVAAELDISYTGSLTARIYPEFDEQVHVVDTPIAYDPDVDGGNVELCIDFGVGHTAGVIFQDHPNEYRAIAEFEVTGNAVPEVVAPEIMRILREKGVPERLLAPQWTARFLMVGDPAGEGREQISGRTLVNEYRRHGFTIRTRRFPITRTVLAVKRLLMGRPKPLVISGPDCPLLVEHFKNNRWVTDKTGAVKSPAMPLNDRHNHQMRAVAYITSYKWPPPSTDAALDRARSAADGDKQPSDVIMAPRRTGLSKRTRL